MNTTTITRTDALLASMLTENTGRHFLDSGGYSGRAWQRNQAAVALTGNEDHPAQHFLNGQEAWADSWGCVTVDMFHFLRQRIDYSPTVDHAWRLWLYTDPERCTNSSGTFDEFVETLIKKGWAERHEFGGGGYTYNDENALSQDFVWQPFTLTDDCPFVEYETTFVGISIHNGADARGGFTDFRIFECDSGDGIYSLLDYGSYSLDYECDGVNDPNPDQLSLDGVEAPRPCVYAHGRTLACEVRGGDVQWYGDGCDVPQPEQHEWADNDPDMVLHGHDDTFAYDCDCGGTLRRTGVYAPCAN